MTTALSPRPDGALTGRGELTLALTGERLQARIGRDGLRELVVWGSGSAADVRFEPPLPRAASLHVTPNRIRLDWHDGWLQVSALPRLPALVLRGGGALPTLRLVTPRRVPPGFDVAARRFALADGWCVASDWTHTLVHSAGGASLGRGRTHFGEAGVAVVAAGAHAGEAEDAAQAVLADPTAREGELDAYQRRLREVLELPDPELQSLVLHGLHAAFSARKTLADAPLFFALLACEVAAWTEDPELLAYEVDGLSLDARVKAVLERAHAHTDADGLPLKPPHDRDWADNVFRGGVVTYQVGLYHGALTRVAALIEGRDPARAARYRSRARALRRAARRTLWRDELGHFVEFREPDGRAEAHLAIDTLTALRYGLADDPQAERVLGAMRRRLETRHNQAQPYGDWGVMSVFPTYAGWVRRRGKSCSAYRYHNGGDWPYWDGVYAEQRLPRDLPGWRYGLTRWWTYGLQQGWATPVEYFAPPFARGSPSNAWSAMPVAALLLGGFALTPSGGVRAPAWGASVLVRTLADGRRQRVIVPDSSPFAPASERASRHLEVEHDG